MKTIQIEIKVLNDDGTILHETIAGIEALMVFYSDQIKPSSVAAKGGIKFYGEKKDVLKLMTNSYKIIEEGTKQHVNGENGEEVRCRCPHGKH